MDGFWKVIAAVLLAVVLGLALNKQQKDISILLSLAVCCMATAVAMAYLAPVLDFVRELEALIDMQSGILGILLKAVGIGLVVELAGMICNDAGNASLGKGLQILGSAAILYLSIPVFRTLLTLIREILGQL